MPLPHRFLAQLNSFFSPDAVLTDPAECWVYGYDNSKLHCAPDVVVFPFEHEQVVALVKLCNEFKIPLVARGRGTSTTGSAVPIQQGVVVSMERMDRILKVDPANRVIVAQAGVTNQAIQIAAQQYGFMWAPDPGSAAYCTIGGNLAVNAAGPRAVKYGTARENTLGLRIVTGSSEDFYTGVYTTKGVVGYDLTRLIIGSEGTLAIITEAILKLIPLAESKTTLQATYTSIEAAARAVTAIMAQPVIPCALEFIDEQAIKLLHAHAKLKLPTEAKALLLIDIDGNNTALTEMAAAVQAAAKIEGVINIEIARDAAHAQTLWAARKALSPALRNIAPQKINEDVVVPVSRIPELISGLKLLAAQYAITIVNFGHAGNGNIHVNLMFDSANKLQADNIQLCLTAVFDLVLKLDGTLSGEHGIGMIKQNYINRELAPAALALMRKIKQQFDPNIILNPGKLFPVCNKS